MRLATKYYRVARHVFAPNPELRRGVDTVLFSPEKNVRMLAALERALMQAHAPAFRILVVGQGGKRGWLQSNMRMRCCRVF
jgi:hypothetical protein